MRLSLFPSSLCLPSTDTTSTELVTVETWRPFFLYNLCRAASFSILTVLVVTVGCRLMMSFANVLGGSVALLRKPRALLSLLPYLVSIVAMLFSPVGLIFLVSIQIDLAPDGSCNLEGVHMKEQVSTLCFITATYIPVLIFSMFTMWSRPKAYVRRCGHYTEASTTYRGLSATDDSERRLTGGELSERVDDEDDGTCDSASLGWISHSLITPRNQHVSGVPSLDFEQLHNKAGGRAGYKAPIYSP